MWTASYDYLFLPLVSRHDNEGTRFNAIIMQSCTTDDIVELLRKYICNIESHTFRLQPLTIFKIIVLAVVLTGGIIDKTAIYKGNVPWV